MPQLSGRSVEASSFQAWVERLSKPECLLQPGRLARRLLNRRAVPASDGMYRLPLPWKMKLQVSRLDNVACAVDVLGVHNLVVTEAIWRLVAPGDTVVDVGANVGYMSMVMAARLRSRGRVFSFEPQPSVLDELSANLASAQQRFSGVTVEARFEALSDTDGTARLALPPPDQNRGAARIDPDGARTVPVPMRRLDEYARAFGDDVALMKIDVEGHEPAVLRGAAGLLERRVFRHVIAEEHGRYPTEATALLERCGYTLYSLERGLLGVRLGDVARPARVSWHAPSLIATRDPEALKRAFRIPGWRSLSLAARR